LAVKFLSEEWAKAFTDAMNSSDDFKQAAGTQTSKVQNVVNSPEGEKRFYLKLENGQVDVGTGDLPEAEATITQDYDTAVALFKNELTGTAAYMSGKLKVQGDLMKLMQMQGVQSVGQKIHSSLDVEY
jgi:putative sterol carrier protein